MSNFPIIFRIITLSSLIGHFIITKCLLLSTKTFLVLNSTLSFIHIALQFPMILVFLVCFTDSSPFILPISLYVKGVSYRPGLVRFCLPIQCDTVCPSPQLFSSIYLWICLTKPTILLFTLYSFHVSLYLFPSLSSLNF